MSALARQASRADFASFLEMTRRAPRNVGQERAKRLHARQPTAQFLLPPAASRAICTDTTTWQLGGEMAMLWHTLGEALWVSASIHLLAPMVLLDLHSASPGSQSDCRSRQEPLRRETA